MNVRKEFIIGRVFTLPNVKTEWAYLVEPDVKFGKSQWCIDVRIEDKMAESLLEVGFNVKHTKDKKTFKEGDELYYFMKVYRKTSTAKGPMSPPKVVDAGAIAMDGSLVGNGSVCNVKVFAKYCEVNGDTFLPARLNAVQVVKLVEYSGDEGFEPIGSVTPDADDMFGSVDQNAGSVPF